MIWKLSNIAMPQLTNRRYPQSNNPGTFQWDFMWFTQRSSWGTTIWDKSTAPYTKGFGDQLISKPLLPSFYETFPPVAPPVIGGTLLKS